MLIETHWKALQSTEQERFLASVAPLKEASDGGVGEGEREFYSLAAVALGTFGSFLFLFHL